MQDRFKFRLYDKKIKEMIYADNKTQNNINIINYLIYCNNSFIDWDIENYALMQCTGLKDKNGKLIYEGDIFKTQEFCRGKEYYCYSVIKYSDGGYYLEGSYVTSGNTLKFINYDIRNISEDLLESGLFDLVGNIYENPELLEVNDGY